MKLSQFLNEYSVKHGRAFTEGAMAFVALDRPLDQVIRHVLALGPHHPGEASPWSHCFLIAEQYHGRKTKILDCSIRDRRNRMLWGSTLEVDIEVLAKGVQGCQGKIYSGYVSDYDNERVQACGLYFLPELTAKERHKIVRVAAAMQKRGYRYDLPGLVRELVRLLIGVTWKQGKRRLLFCSAFLATVYRTSLGKKWKIAPGIASVDITPDEIWYSGTGERERILND